MFFSNFLLLNACVGFSSAPFYLPGLNCNRVEPTPDCEQLQKATSAMYTVELIGAVILIIHGLLLTGLIDNIKSIKLLRAVNKITKVLIVIYLIMIIVRIGLYFRVHSDLVGLDTKNLDQGFGNFLASYMADGP
jgi:uncharacterized membrane protein